MRSITKCLLALPLFALACGSPEDEAELAASEPAVDAHSAALCTDAGAANYSAQLTVGDVGGTVSSTAPNTSYGSSQCVGRYVVEATSTQGAPNLRAGAEMPSASAPGSQASCGNAYAIVSVYGFNPATGQWVTVVSNKKTNGQWTATFGGYYCSVASAVTVPSSYTKVRSAGEAWYRPSIYDKPIKRLVTGFISANR